LVSQLRETCWCAYHTFLLGFPTGCLLRTIRASPISLYFLCMDQLGGFSDLSLFPEHASAQNGHTSVGRDVATVVMCNIRCHCSTRVCGLRIL
jgi:hypothetical protein